MKRGGLRSWGLITVLLLLAASVFADEVAQNFESRVVETFDADSGRKWTAVGSKFTAPGFPQQQLVESWPNALFRNPKEIGENFRSLGIHGKFTRKGDNYVELIPVKDDGNGGLVANPIMLPGRVKNLDLWVWGSNFNYYLEAHVRDYNGIVHVLKLGDLRYIGWKKLQIAVPPIIAQSVQYVPKYRPLELTKLVVWTQPNERTDDFFVYFDQMMVFTDMFESPFDGDMLTNPEMVQEVWAKAGKQ